MTTVIIHSVMLGILIIMKLETSKYFNAILYMYLIYSLGFLLIKRMEKTR